MAESRRLMARLLLRNVEALDDQRAARAVLLEEGGELLGRRDRRLERLRLEQLQEFRVPEQLRDLGVDAADDRVGRAGRHHQAPPRRSLELFVLADTGLLESRNVGKLAQPLRAGHGDEARLA